MPIRFAETVTIIPPRVTINAPSVTIIQPVTINRRRGRPCTGEAIPSAERQRAYRARIAAEKAGKPRESQ